MKKFTRSVGGLIIAFNLAACGNKTDTPEPTLETACPQVKTTATKIVESDYPTSQESDLTIKITGELTHNDEGLLNATSLLIDKARLPERPNIRMYIASTGGEISQGFALRDTIQHYGADKFTLLCTTQASSAMTYIFTNNSKRYALPACGMTTHAAAGSVHEPEKIPKEELERIKAALEVTKVQRTKQIRELYKYSLNLTDTCAKYLTRQDDTDLSAYDALKLGFLDAILEPNGKMTIRAPQDKPDGQKTNGSVEPK